MCYNLKEFSLILKYFNTLKQKLLDPGEQFAMVVCIQKLLTVLINLIKRHLFYYKKI